MTLAARGAPGWPSPAELMAPERAPSRWTTDDVELWLIDAMQTERKLDGRRVRPTEPRALWPDVRGEPMDWPKAETPVHRLLAEPEQIDRYDRVVGWLAWLPVRARRIVRARAAGRSERQRSWRTIARHATCGHETCRRTYYAALGTIRDRLNHGS